GQGDRHPRPEAARVDRAATPSDSQGTGGPSQRQAAGPHQSAPAPRAAAPLPVAADAGQQRRGAAGEKQGSAQGDTDVPRKGTHAAPERPGKTTAQAGRGDLARIPQAAGLAGRQISGPSGGAEGQDHVCEAAADRRENSAGSQQKEQTGGVPG